MGDCISPTILIILRSHIYLQPNEAIQVFENNNIHESQISNGFIIYIE